jgi:hypothetical protein
MLKIFCWYVEEGGYERTAAREKIPEMRYVMGRKRG